jgi:hypothetical protein
MQQPLFTDTTDTNASRKGLAINKSHQKQVLSKQQQAFNRLVKRIEKLQAELKSTSVILDDKLDYYAANLHPLEKQATDIRVEIVKLIFGYYGQKKLFSAKEKSDLREILETQMGNIFSAGVSPDEELKKIFEKIHGIKYEEAAEEDFQEMKAEMENMFEDFGFDINLDGLHSKMTPEEMMAKMAEMQQEFNEQANNKQNKTDFKKTKKQQEKEEREKQVEEAKKKNINGIYRQLAKIFHPDLEPDETVRLEKEELMKQLTVANENNDLHTLLRLEMQWLQKEDNDPAKLSEEKLGIYNQVMKEQVADLEHALFELENHPRFAPLQKYALYPGQIKTINLGREKGRIKDMLQDMGQSLTALKKSEDDAVSEIKTLIKQFRQSREADDEAMIDFEEAIAHLMQQGPRKRK